MAFLDVLKLIFIPALIAAAIYLLLAYVIIPLYRNHYLRYSQYLPLDGLSSRTSNVRTRVADAISQHILPAHMRWRREVVNHRGSVGDDVYFGEEEGERMVGFDVSRRERLGRGGSGAGEEIPSEMRLSRDLEEGFRDSDEDGSDGVGDDRRR